MNKIILTLLAIGFMATACYASDGTVTVNRGSGTYIVGSSQRERGSISTYNMSIPMCKEKDLKTDFNKPIPKPEKPKWNGN